MTLRLAAPSLADVQAVRRWRESDDVRLGLRTPYMLTEAMQERFYLDVVSNRSSPHRYWSVRGPGTAWIAGAVAEDRADYERVETEHLVAFAGLTNIEWESGHAEISLLVDPARSGEGIGATVVGLVLREAFERSRLETVFGECYEHNPALGFWKRMLERFHGEYTTIPRRKYWDGQLQSAVVFWFAHES